MCDFLRRLSGLFIGADDVFTVQAEVRSILFCIFDPENLLLKVRLYGLLSSLRAGTKRLGQAIGTHRTSETLVYTTAVFLV